MNPTFIIALILAVVAGIFFIYGTLIASVKHVGIGGILLTIAVVILLLLGNSFL